MSKQAKPSGIVRPQTTPIAIVGMASIFANARNVKEYWDNISRKIDCITDVPASRWSIEDYYDPNPSTPDKSYCKRGAFIPDIDFDPTEFGLPPNILEATDVSQLLALAVAKEALVDAGLGEGSEFNHDRAGVILGVVGISMKLFVALTTRLQYPVWEKVLRSAGVPEADIKRIVEKAKLAYPNWEENSFPGIIGNVIAGRIANRFDFGGTNCTVDAACGTSLAAVKMAAQELITRRADVMLTGAVDLDNSIGTYMCFSKTPAFSKGEHVRTFDADTDGMMAGEGIGMLVLKRLEDAECDGDRIYAVIHGVGSSSDGRFKSIYAPRAEGQAKAIRRAYEEAGFDPRTVSLVEAHGTGTRAGDPEEVEGMRQVFGLDNPDKQYIALGSVKSQIAHTKAAAGSASLIKTALALYHKVLPPTLNVTKPNPKLDLENSPFYLNTETRPWFRLTADTPRRAGVSSFGFGGTNFHVALEEYQADHNKPYRLTTTSQTIILSAPSQNELVSACQGTLAKLQGEDALAFYNELAAQSQTAEIPTAHARLGFAADSFDEAHQLLQTAVEQLKAKTSEKTWEHPKGIYYRDAGIDPHGKVVAVFPGQGSQYVDMGKELAMNFPTMRQAFDQMNALFRKDGAAPLSQTVYPKPVFDNAQKDQLTQVLTRTDHAQPAIGTFSVGLYRLLLAAGFTPDFTAGHSFGELTALWAGGVLSDEDYFFLIRARGKAMAPPDDPNFDAGTMLAVKGDGEKIRQDIKDMPGVTLANDNSRDQVVLAGAKPAIAAAQKALADKGYSVTPLSVSAAFHTALVGHAQKPFAQAIQSVKFKKPSARVFSNTTSEEYSTDPKAIQKTLTDHILNPVLFKDEIEHIYAAGGSIFVEIGPKSVVTSLVKNILAGRPHIAVALNANPKKDSDRQLCEAYVQLKVAGLKLKQIDPFKAAPHSAPKKKKGMSIMLNGGLYMTDKTKTAFDKALNDGWKVSLASQPAAPTAPASQPAQVIQPAAPATPAQAARPSVHETAPAITSMQQTMVKMQEHQTEMLRMQSAFLNQQAEFSQNFMMLMQQQMALMSSGAVSPNFQMTVTGPAQPAAVTMPATPAPTAAAAVVPTMPLGDGPDKLAAAPAPAEAPKPASAEETDANTLAKGFMQIVSEKTGYPVEMLDPGMDMEADLGIDSIKRVEILGAVQEKFPSLPKIEPANLSDLRTLAQIVEKLGAGLSATPTLRTPEAVGGAVNRDELAKGFLQIVSEKTGYPVEMLEIGMDMEADLGIDSIKRVEILGAVQEKFPSLPKIEPANISELRTLGQIIDRLAEATPLPFDQPAQASAEPETPAHGISLGFARLKLLPAPDILNISLPEGHICLISDDGSALTPNLAGELRSRGWKVVVLSFPQSIVPKQLPLPTGIKRITLADMTEETLAKTLAEISQTFGPIGTFIHIDPSSLGFRESEIVFSEPEGAIMKHIFLVAKHLKEVLNTAAHQGRAVFMAVTRLDGKFGLGLNSNFTPISGGFFGLVKSLNLEWELVFCRAVDLSPELENEKAVECILSELLDPNRLVTEVGYDQNDRVTLIVEQM